MPNRCATIPLVAGTVESHKKPKLAPNKKAEMLLAGIKINNIIETPNSQSTLDAIKEAFASKSYILLVSGFFVCGFHITLVGTHVPTYVIDRGLESWTAAAILSLIGLFNIFGSLLSGYLSTKISKKIILSFI